MSVLEINELSQIYNLLDIDTATRWFEFRETLFSKEHIYNHIDKLYNTITQSGSLQRDFNKWGLYYSGVDNMENLYSFIDARMEYLDEYYKEFLS